MKNHGVPSTCSFVASAWTAAICFVTVGALGIGLDLGGVEPGHLGQDLVDQRVGHPAGVLLALVLVEEPDDLPELVLEPGGDGDPQRLLGVRAEEGEPAEVDLDPARA